MGDTGFNADPTYPLRALGADPQTVHKIIVPHLHHDHVGSSDLFPNAAFYLQDKEIAFSTSRYMRHAFFRAMYEVEDVTGFGRRKALRAE